MRTASAADSRTLDATLLGTARLGLRHGSFGDDFHAYHNEFHVLEVGERRLLRLFEPAAGQALSAADWSSADDVRGLP